jgi:hypothetical protein
MPAKTIAAMFAAQRAAAKQADAASLDAAVAGAVAGAAAFVATAAVISLLDRTNHIAVRMAAAHLALGYVCVRAGLSKGAGLLAAAVVF